MLSIYNLLPSSKRLWPNKTKTSKHTALLTFKHSMLYIYFPVLVFVLLCALYFDSYTA